MILQSEMLFFGFYKNQIMCCAKPLPDPLPPLYTVTKPCPPPLIYEGPFPPIHAVTGICLHTLQPVKC